MKKGWKIFWLTCGITLVVGIALLGIGLGMGATMEIVKERAPIKETYSPNIQESYQGIRELDLDIAAGEIKILKAPKEQQEITVETQKISKSLKFKCYEEEGVLNITTNKKVWNWIYARNHAQDAKIYVYIPEGYRLEEVEMNLSAGSIYIEDIHTLGDADLESGVGEINFTAIGNETDYNYDLNCDIGSIVCGEREFTEIGSEYQIENQSDKTMSIECGVGEVNVQFQAEQS